MWMESYWIVRLATWNNYAKNSLRISYPFLCLCLDLYRISFEIM